MNFSELVPAVAKESGLSAVDAEKGIRATLNVIQTQVERGKDVKIVGFGTFGVVKRKARVGRNPQTGEAVKIAACRVPKFKPGKSFKDGVRSR